MLPTAKNSPHERCGWPGWQCCAGRGAANDNGAGMHDGGGCERRRVIGSWVIVALVLALLVVLVLVVRAMAVVLAAGVFGGAERPHHCQ